jgi:hypothetical protein
MDRLGEVFPFSHDDEGRVTASTEIGQAAGLLPKARDAEARAMTFLGDITKIQAPRADS